MNKLMQFNNRALVNYFIVYALKQHTDLELRDAVKPLIDFAKYLQKDLDFTIDLGILATANDRRFMLNKPELPLTVIDRLFVATADEDYMLMNSFSFVKRVNRGNSSRWSIAVWSVGSSKLAKPANNSIPEINLGRASIISARLYPILSKAPL